MNGLQIVVALMFLAACFWPWPLQVVACSIVLAVSLCQLPGIRSFFAKLKRTTVRVANLVARFRRRRAGRSVEVLASCRFVITRVGQDPVTVIC
jgi:hypothetical protein